MARRQRKKEDPPELNITTFLNLMVVLIPFLLISAVFSRITIQELNVPTASGGSGGSPNFSIDVVIRELGFEIDLGHKTIAAIPKVDDDYDMKKLSEMLVRLKAQYPDKEDATILMEPKIEYDHLIRTMDVVRSGRVEGSEGAALQTLVLFPNISIGDAP